jgi:hypothetical protein
MNGENPTKKGLCLTTEPLNIPECNQNGLAKNVEKFHTRNQSNQHYPTAGRIVLLFIFSSLFHNQADHRLI